MTNAFPNRARQHVVSPIAGPSLFVGRNIWRHQPGQVRVGPDYSGSKFAGNGGRSRFAKVGFRMTSETARYSIDQVSSTLEPGCGYFEAAVSQLAGFRSHESPPTNRKCDSERYNDEQY